MCSVKKIDANTKVYKIFLKIIKPHHLDIKIHPITSNCLLNTYYVLKTGSAAERHVIQNHFLG